jgi:tetratricopeptide (TPR) repeat protein
MLVVYLATMAPSLSFWDCGEFITCSYIMGIPHPPGAPMLSLVGRVMSLIPFVDPRGIGTGEIAYRVNMIDVLLGALTVMLTYFIMLRIIHRFRPYRGSRLEESIAGFAAALTALTIGFADEFWTNAIETETYMPSLFMSMVALWLALRWHELRKERGAVRYLFLAAYIIGLGNGVHLSVLLIAPTIFLVVLFGRPDWFASKNLWGGIFVLLGVAAAVKLFTGLTLLYSLMALFALVVPLLLSRFYRHEQRVWMLTLCGLMLCGSLYVIGFSVYPTVMVRASTEPSINEGDPDTWERYRLYIERDQYGQENMYVGMFNRNAGAYYQFGFMYARYLIQQFPSWGPTVPVTFRNDSTADQPIGANVVETVYLPVFLVSLLLYGLYTHAREDKKIFAALLLYFLATSVGLALYLNMENPQVRERGYFFLGSYYIIMYWIGLGVWGIVTDFIEWLRETGRNRFETPAAAVLMVLFATLPPTAVLSRHINPNFTNYEVHDRTHDWIPWDYGYNILISCEPNAILFTNGDNDTFPLWYLQEIHGIRKDVRIINLSLLNTPWYIKQVKNENTNIHHKYLKTIDEDIIASREVSDAPDTVPMKYTDDYIDDVICGSSDESFSIRMLPPEGKEITAAGITWTLPPAHILDMSDGQKVGLLRIQDVMVAQIIQWLNWERPIYFAVTVAQQNKIGLERHLAMEGMVYRLNDHLLESDVPVNVERMEENVFTRYRYRSLDDPTIYKPPNTVKLVTNYFIGFAQLSERYASRGDQDNAVRAARAAIERTPNDFSSRLFLYQVFYTGNMPDQLTPFLEDEITSGDYTDWRHTLQEDRMLLAALCDYAGLADEADAVVTFEAGIAGDDFDSRLRLSSILVGSGLERHAQKYINDLIMAFEAVDGGIDFDSQLRFVTLLIRGGYESHALKYVSDLKDDHPDNKDAWKTYIAALYSTGNYQEALDATKQLMTIAPNDPMVKDTYELLRSQIESGADSIIGEDPEQ